MFSTCDCKMWPSDGKLKPSYPPMSSSGDKTTRRFDSRNTKVYKNSLLSFKQGDSNIEVPTVSKPRKMRDAAKNLTGLKNTSRNKERRGVPQSLDVIKMTDTDILVRRKPNKAKKDAKLFPGKLYREKTFGVFSTPNDCERPSNVPRRRLQPQDCDPLNRGYISDVKSEISRPYNNEREEFHVDHKIRPKSAGQALYHVDSDDDSSLDGEIEVIDIDNDDAFIVIQDTESIHFNDGYFKESTYITNSRIDSRHSQENVYEANRYHGNTEYINKQDSQFNLGESEKRDGRSHLENYSRNNASSDNTLSPATFDRRRVKSDSSAIPMKDNFIDRRRESEVDQHDIKKTNGLHTRKQSNTKVDSTLPEMSSENTYAQAVEKVLTKYSNMSVRASEKDFDSTVPRRYVSRTGLENQAGYGHRTSLPRKLKPLLNREKIGHVSHNTTGKEIDYRVPFS